MSTIIDWEAIKASYWGGQENLNTKRKKQAELMILENIPFNFITGVGCYNEKAKNELTQMGVDENIIKIIPQAYF